MGFNFELFTLIILCASVIRVQGVCRHVDNDDMIEYSCMGGQLSDLNDLPASTGKLRISNMPIRQITADTFSRFGSDLWVLGCSHCGIMDIEPGAFQRLNNLQQLSLDNNHLTAVKGSCFKGLDYLTYLDLNYNNIESIEDEVFRNLPSLVDLRLSGNRLECLNLEAMSHLKDLKRMFLTENSEFKCPNAVSAFLDSRGVSFEKDPEWRRLPQDLVPVEFPIDYETDDEDTITEQPTTPLPAFRERLHPTSTIPPRMTDFMEPPYITPRFYTTEEVVYRPTYNTQDWRTTSTSSTPRYQEPVHSTTPPPELLEEDRPVYAPPRTIPPLEPRIYPSFETTQPTGQDTTTFRSWPRFPESTSARPEFPFYPPHKIEDEANTEQPDYSGPDDTFPLAVGPTDRQWPGFYQESDPKHGSDRHEVDWSSRSTVASNTIAHVVNVDAGPPEYRVSTMQPPTPPRAVEQLPYSPPGMVQPASADNVYQAPYYEHAVTVHSPPLVIDRQGEVQPAVVPVDTTMTMTTTTDKPLPDCPTRNRSASSQTSIAMIIVSVVLAIRGRVLVEGF